MQKKKLYINTIGCQMNVYDSEQIAAALKPQGYDETSGIKDADLIIVNTCAIREKAEQKVFSFLGRLAGLKRTKPDIIIAVGGCVAQQKGEKILERAPYLDVVFGTHAIGRLPNIIRRVADRKIRIIDVGTTTTIDDLELSRPTVYGGDVTRFVTIMRGCDNYCTYCVVPYVRGEERSRDPERIVREISELVATGVREVTLLGQNVNSYGKKEGLCSFSQMLYRVNGIADLLRIRFTTSHPKDLSDELINAFDELPKLCNHIHLPVQSGSNKILIKMNRKYQREKYLEKVDKLRIKNPGIAISSDFIVGFPGETSADFEKTLNLIKTVEYDSLFAFKYSDRPNASAARLSDKIQEQEKTDRLQRLLDLQEEITLKKNRSLVGSTQIILVEGLSKKQSTMCQQTRSSDDLQWTGRTSTNTIVNFIRGEADKSDNEMLTGKLVRVRIDKAYPHSLWGKAVPTEPSLTVWKGVASDAA
jgi:tRNA-2-methylthio-N6-dimethylallyladenosine synthase